jgi:hypothetical protein
VLIFVEYFSFSFSFSFSFFIIIIIIIFIFIYIFTQKNQTLCLQHRPMARRPGGRGAPSRTHALMPQLSVLVHGDLRGPVASQQQYEFGHTGLPGHAWDDDPPLTEDERRDVRRGRSHPHLFRMRVTLVG